MQNMAAHVPSPKRVSYLPCGTCRIGILSDIIRNIENALHYVTPVNLTVNSGGRSLPVLWRADEWTIGLEEETPHRQEAKLLTVDSLTPHQGGIISVQGLPANIIGVCLSRTLVIVLLNIILSCEPSSSLQPSLLYLRNPRKSKPLTVHLPCILLMVGHVCGLI
ncbi:hypothetical protein I7I48_04062 [Histoplasma ohiense]|nr:hypothetical protein I7I48_04062 [Histoplasma ohiense (nom. inval.)]